MASLKKSSPSNTDPAARELFDVIVELAGMNDRVADDRMAANRDGICIEIFHEK